MKIATWYNLTQKAYEATEITRGRPIRQDASVEDRKKSNRDIFVAKTKEDVLKAIAKANGVKVDDLEVVKDTKMVYKGKRDHPYTKSEQPAA